MVVGVVLPIFGVHHLTRTKSAETLQDEIRALKKTHWDYQENWQKLFGEYGGRTDKEYFWDPHRGMVSQEPKQNAKAELLLEERKRKTQKYDEKLIQLENDLLLARARKT